MHWTCHQLHRVNVLPWNSFSLSGKNTRKCKTSHLECHPESFNSLKNQPVSNIYTFIVCWLLNYEASSDHPLHESPFWPLSFCSLLSSYYVFSVS